MSIEKEQSGGSHGVTAIHLTSTRGEVWICGLENARAEDCSNRTAVTATCSGVNFETRQELPLSPMMPSIMHIRDINLMVEVDSAKSTMPRTAVPAAPIPVHTA